MVSLNKSPPMQYNRYTGMEIIVLPDDDPLLAEVEPGQVGCDGHRLYIGETLWAQLKGKLRGNS